MPKIAMSQESRRRDAVRRRKMSNLAKGAIVAGTAVVLSVWGYLIFA